MNTLRRRSLILAGAAAGLAGISRFAGARRALTPRQSEGPFYPLHLPLDSDNDLVRIAGRAEGAAGVWANVVGRVLDEGGKPVRGARVEIWQCDATGRYHHPGDRGGVAIDPNFQGFGATITDGDGAYRFRTIRPVPYPGRTAHIHFKIKGAGFEALTTQMYVADDPGNARDGLFNRIRDPALRRSVSVAFEPNPDQSAELIARFEIVIRADPRFEPPPIGA